MWNGLLVEDTMAGTGITELEAGRACRVCASPAFPGDRFCRQCGERLHRDPSNVLTAVDGERRHLTVMFCDLVNSTPLAERLDPEDYEEVLRAFQGACAAAIEQHDGRVGRFQGDGMLVYFGYPRAGDDDPRRAVLASLAVVESVANLAATLPDAGPLAARVGIHTGLVVIADMGAGDRREPHDVVGETPAVAARLQSLAAPATVVVSGATAALLGNWFRMEDLGDRRLRGLSRQLRVYRIVGTTSARGRLVRSRHGPATLVGRDDAFDALHRLWEVAANGGRPVVLITGDAGIGKSRLVQALADHISSLPHRLLELSCYSSDRHTPMRPLVELLEHHLGLDEEDGPDGRGRRLKRHVETLVDGAPVGEDWCSLVASVVGAAVGEEGGVTHDLTITPEQLRRRTIEAVVGVLRPPPESPASLLVVEDVHWADPTTLEALDLLATDDDHRGTLLVLTARTGLRLELGGIELEPIHLRSLDPAEAAELAVHFAGARALDPGELDEIVTHGDGIPLFVEELTRSLVDGHTGVPASLHDVLAARLDRLGPARPVAQVAAVVGRRFSRPVLEALLPGADVDGQLAGLVAEGLVVREDGSEDVYAFRQALVRDVAYELLLKRARRQLHAKVAELLLEQRPDAPELAAQHHAVAGQALEAVRAWRRASRMTMAQAAYGEAVTQLRQALESLATLPPSPENERRELQLRLPLAWCLLRTTGHGCAEVGEVLQRCERLIEHIDERRHLLFVLPQLVIHLEGRGEHRVATRKAEELLALAEELGNDTVLPGAHQLLGSSLIWRGRLDDGLAEVETALTLTGRASVAAVADIATSETIRLSSLAISSLALWLSGRVEDAHQRSAEAIEIGHAQNGAPGLGAAYIAAALLAQLEADTAEVRRLSALSIGLAADSRSDEWASVARLLDGWARAAEGEHEAGVLAMRGALEDLRVKGMVQLRPLGLALIAERVSGLEPEEAIRLVDEGLGLGRANDERVWEAELLCIRSEVLGSQGRDVEARASLAEAVSVAASQGATQLEQRAATALAEHMGSGAVRSP